MYDIVKVTWKLNVSLGIGPHINLKTHILYSHKTSNTVHGNLLPYDI